MNSDSENHKIAEKIQGVLLTPLKRIANPKGEVMHAMKSTSPGYSGFGEAYFSMVLPGATKGWKRHRRVTLNLVVPVGEVRFVIFDDRVGSATSGCFGDYVLGKANYSRLTISHGLWVAFHGVGTQDNILINLASEEHDPAESDNAGIEEIPFDWNNYAK